MTGDVPYGVFCRRFWQDENPHWRLLGLNPRLNYHYRCLRKNTPQYGVEGLKQQGVTLRVEGRLVPQMAEGDRRLIVGMPPVLIPGVSVSPQVVRVVVRLEEAMVLNYPIGTF